MVDLNDMILFTRVVDCGSISAAGREIGQPKSTISRRLKQLEEGLGVRLLQRTTRSLKLTELGAVFYDRCKRVRTEVEEAERWVSLGQEKPRGVLRVTAPVETGFARIGKLIAKYSESYPEVSIELDMSNRLVDLVEEGYDLAIRAGTLPDSRLVARKLGNTQMLVCSSPSYLAKQGTPRSPRELGNHQMVLYGTSRRRQSFTFLGAMGKISVQLEPKHCANSLQVLRDMVKSGYGITLLPESHVNRDIANGSLLRLLEHWHLPEDGIYAVYPSPRHLTPKVRSFIDFLSLHLELTD